MVTDDIAILAAIGNDIIIETITALLIGTDIADVVRGIILTDVTNAMARLMAAQCQLEPGTAPGLTLGGPPQRYELDD